MKDYILKLEKRLERLNARLKLLEASHIGNEINFTYWGGFTMGQLKGTIMEIENTLDELRSQL